MPRSLLLVGAALALAPCTAEEADSEVSKPAPEAQLPPEVAKADEPQRVGEKAHDEPAENDEPAPALAGLPPPPVGEKPAPGPLKFDPVEAGDGRLPTDHLVGIDPDLGTMLNHLGEFGWSRDGKAFLYCMDDLGPGDCHFIPIEGKRVDLEGEDKRWKKLVKANRPLSKGAKSWPYGDITITWKALEAKLQVGGRIGESSGKADIYKFNFDPEDFTDAAIFPEVISVSPDGAQMIVLAHAALGELFDDVQPKLVATASFAATVYSATGFQSLKAESFVDAAKWFARATATGKHWKHPFNLACARSRGKLEGVETALRVAIDRGGDKVKDKARTDDDLENVRSEPWFKRLVG